MVTLIAVSLCIWLYADLTSAVVNKDSQYTNRWVAHIEGGENVAQAVARSLGFKYKGQLGRFDNYYELVREDHPELSLQRSEHVTRSLQDLDEVKWAKQQRVFKNVYKSLLKYKSQQEEDEVKEKEAQLVHFIKQEVRKTADDPQHSNWKNSIFSWLRFPFSFRKLFTYLGQRNISKLGTFSTKPTPHSQLDTYKGVTKNIGLQSMKISAYEVTYNDPLWTKQWYVQDYRTKDIPVMDHNVVPVYKMGYTGKGVTVAVIDHPLPLDHPDLKTNIDIEKSYDLCLDKPLSEVIAQHKVENPHGAEIAGLISMIANNKICGVGIAYDAKIAAMNDACSDDQESTDADFMKKIVQNLEMIDIYNCSWGPPDDAKTVCEISEMIINTYEKALTKGRKGKGAIYIQSAGNGGAWGDICATDCYINQPRVIAITSAAQNGKKSDYGELCTAIFAATYSGNYFPVKGKVFERLATLGLNGECTTNAVGTSQSAPVASGIVALLLEANPDLTYRDVMHIIARSAEVAPLANNYGWYRNGQGFWVSNSFGFGLMNAENMVVLSQNWKTVPDRHTCFINIKLNTPELLNADKKVMVPFETEACANSPTKNVVYMEHLEVRSVVQYACRGDIRVFITSPAGTKSLLLDNRMQDRDEDGLEGWPIMSVHNWGENPQGKWILEFEIIEQPRGKGLQGYVKEFTVTFYGMGERRQDLEAYRKYAAFRLADGKNELGEQV